MLQQLTKDPYKLKFLTLTTPVAEGDLERALVAQVERFLLELATGLAFVGRARRLELDDDEFFAPTGTRSITGDPRLVTQGLTQRRIDAQLGPVLADRFVEVRGSNGRLRDHPSS